MTTPTVIGRTSFIRGRVSGTGDLEIAGRVEGDIACSGSVLVEAGGLVAANITAARIVVRGAVKGDLVAEETLLVEAGARVVGDLRAPRIAIAPGGLVRGHVQTGAAGTAKTRTATQTARSTVSTPARAATPAARAEARPAPAPAKQVAAAVTKTNVSSAPHRGSALAGSRPGPPAPVVPVLRKGTKAVQKKRA